MSKWVKITILNVFLIIFVSCSFIKNRPSHGHRPEVQADSAQNYITVSKSRILNYLRPHMVAALEYYGLGEYEASHNEFQSAFFYLDLIGITDATEKLLFLKNQLEPEIFQEADIAAIFAEVSAFQNGASVEAESDTMRVVPISEEIAYQDSIDLPLLTTEYKRFIADEIAKLALKFGEDSDLQLPDDFIREVEMHILSFQSRKREFFETSLRRSRKYIPLINPIFAAKEIPEELAYMAIVESGFSPTAISRARALGLWQFMRRTGKLYGLKVTQARDERYDPVKSTYAASEYLLDLLTIFGSRSFMLAIASYNTGEGNIQKALRKLSSYKERNFWVLRTSGYLHRETGNYVPQILAAIVIGKNLAKFGFQELPFIDPDSYEIVFVPQSIQLSNLYDIGLNRDEIFQLNPDLEPNATKTPARVINYPLFVPKDKKALVESKIARFHKTQERTEPVYQTASLSAAELATSADSVSSADRIVYKVKPGNTLEKISTWFNKSQTELLSWNSFLNSRPLKPGDLIQIYELNPASKKYLYRVKKGDTLYDLSRRYGVTVNDLKEWNGLTSNRIHPGLVLEIYAIKKTTLGATQKLNNGVIEKQQIKPGAPFRYQVVQGNTLTFLANIFGVNEQDIRKWNQLSVDNIQKDQYLTLYATKELNYYRYVVKKGDTLWSIAGNFNLSADQLKEINGLSANQIAIGQQLRIFSQQ